MTGSPFDVAGYIVTLGGGSWTELVPEGEGEEPSLGRTDELALAATDPAEVAVAVAPATSELMTEGELRSDAEAEASCRRTRGPARTRVPLSASRGSSRNSISISSLLTGTCQLIDKTERCMLS